MCKKENDPPEISVLLCVYRPAAAQLAEAVSSIIDQSFQSWEMILYDDGSGREYSRLLEDTAGMDLRIQLIRNPENRRLSGALNEALKLARGRYIARMDGDDLSQPERFRKQYDYLESHRETDWVGCNTYLMDNDGIWGSRNVPERPQPKDFLPYSPYIHPAVMFRKEVLEQAGGYRLSRRGEDYELFMRLTAAGCEGCNIQETLYIYREDKDSYSRRSYTTMVEEMKIRREGFRRLGILNLGTWIYVIKPLIVGLLPCGLQHKLKRRRGKNYVERHSG